MCWLTYFGHFHTLRKKNLVCSYFLTLELFPELFTELFIFYGISTNPFPILFFTVFYIGRDSSYTAAPALRIVGNLLTGFEEQTQVSISFSSAFRFSLFGFVYSLLLHFPYANLLLTLDCIKLWGAERLFTVFDFPSK